MQEVNGKNFSGGHFNERYFSGGYLMIFQRRIFHCNTVKNKLWYSGTPNIFLCIPPKEVYIDQCTPVDNNKINSTIVRRFTLINVHLLTTVKSILLLSGVVH